MGPSSSQVCANRYAALARELGTKGLDREEIEKSRMLNSFFEGPRAYLRPRAYKPTGVALGCPLPDPEFQSLLFEVVLSSNNFIQRISRKPAPSVALVPPSFYHVTIVNRDHFDLGGENRHIQCITPRERALIVRVVRQCFRRSPISVRFKGLLITRSGRLFVPGYTESPAFFRLRDDLYSAMAILRRNAPVTAHIKLGHLLVHLQGRLLRLFERWLIDEASRIDMKLQFDTIYTPAGNIRL